MKESKEVGKREREKNLKTEKRKKREWITLRNEKEKECKEKEGKMVMNECLGFLAEFGDLKLDMYSKSL